MKKLNIKWMFVLAASLLWTACDDEVEHTITQVDAPVLVSTTPENNATQVTTGDITISVTYDKNVFFASSYVDQLTFTGGTLLSADVIGSSNTLTVNVNVPTRETLCTLTIPEGVVTGPNDMPAPAVTVQFTTVELNKTLVTPSASAEAQRVYDYLLENYETRTLSATMAKDGVNGVTGSWNTAGADDVFAWTGEYPAINCFDYGHLYASPANWIDYNDISPVQNWWNAGGLVAAMWHWNVPTADPNTTADPELSFYAENNSFDPANALAEGTWENAVFTADLAEAAGYLKLLQEAGIPVIWRPFHEAAGGWFWWGKDAESFKALWIAMFDYFQAQGLNNLIWVWTSETGDSDWYPGDNYVDIVGRDLYGNAADDCVSQFNTLAGTYGNKMVALSECGYGESTGSTVGLISEQWAAGARWSWFMPWYDADNATTFHADQAWWQDAMSQEFVVSREDLSVAE